MVRISFLKNTSAAFSKLIQAQYCTPYLPSCHTAVVQGGGSDVHPPVTSENPSKSTSVIDGSRSHLDAGFHGSSQKHPLLGIHQSCLVLIYPESKGVKVFDSGEESSESVMNIAESKNRLEQQEDLFYRVTIRLF